VTTIRSDGTIRLTRPIRNDIFISGGSRHCPTPPAGDCHE
jgi:hypothetical protein